MSYYLAIDIGASSGRHILGSLKNEKLELEEVHRFKNGFTQKNGHLCWDTEKLFEEIIAGIIMCQKLGKIPCSIGIDTWGVDFVLINKDNSVIGDAVAYRDNRTDDIDKVLSKYITEDDLYARTGIQKQPFNTIYQLLALKEQQPELLEQSDEFLMIPEYFCFLLTGKRTHEYTNATTTGLINIKSKTWDFDLIDKINLPRHIFGEIFTPGSLLGNFSPDIQKKVGFDCKVVLPCTHDTGSAVVSAPIDENCLYLSSGTWSLIGAELAEPIGTVESRKGNFTNEGGYRYHYRYLKNIMGLWMIQNIKQEYNGKYSFNDLCEAAKDYSSFPSRINVNASRFLAPESMTNEIKSACKNSEQPVPENIGELMTCVYQSLADSYAQAVKEIENITGKIYEKICIVGGGSKDVYLNELTAKACGKKVLAGPIEGTAIGNILVQMIGANDLLNVNEARNLVKRSFIMNEY